MKSTARWYPGAMMGQREIDGTDTVISPISGKKERVFMSNGARIRLMQIFDKEIAAAHQKDNEELRLALCRIKGEILCC
jgi:hypothetical protein